MKYDVEQMKSFFRKRYLNEQEQKILMSFRRDIYDAYLCLLAIENVEPFNKKISQISIKEFLSAVQKNYEDEEYTSLMKNRLEAGIALFKGRDVYYDEDFFNSPKSNDPDMVYGTVANSIFTTTAKTDFSKKQYNFDMSGIRISTENKLADLVEDISALDFCYSVIAEDVGIMLQTNMNVEKDESIPEYRKHLYKYGKNTIALAYENAEFIENRLSEIEKVYDKATKKLNREIKFAKGKQAIKNLFVKNKNQDQETEFEYYEKLLSALSEFGATQEARKTSAKVETSQEESEENQK